ncbi:DUF4625 domain-containing protein [Flammeovirga yaeyamensis]|uniref:DUF4625 domain-containing protein n=1 Tax=Flammeovirga yaeyamensis TaxID=367791 RepID=A0AAX1NBX4_9BACT|nr:hypothetical protein [Flammeovirga yaeyamensis]MBB3697111.1 hypothetical protein [Flammeovirga yaeyamensis]NMF33774.1 hypothetical protein [Flammeovirga yaeyamensis]QWG04960.1 DUF4625 domain-containing protein [Flammeovirga yaeyamensis]
MIKQILYTVISLSFLFFTSCSDSEDVSKEIMQIKNLSTDVVSMSETSSFLEVVTDIDYVDFGYLRIDIHSKNDDGSIWDVTHIYHDVDNYAFHGQFSIPENTFGEYEVIIYLADKENNIISESIDIFIEP